MAPLHSLTPIGRTLPPSYFSPGTSLMNGKVVCSLWAEAYFERTVYRFERLAYGAPWVRTA